MPDETRAICGDCAQDLRDEASAEEAEAGSEAGETTDQF